MSILIEPVAIVKSTRKNLSDDYWGAIISEIELLPHIPVEALKHFLMQKLFFNSIKLIKIKLFLKGIPVEIKIGPRLEYFLSEKKTDQMHWG